jgi:hypothetical protein
VTKSIAKLDVKQHMVERIFCECRRPMAPLEGKGLQFNIKSTSVIKSRLSCLDSRFSYVLHWHDQDSFHIAEPTVSHSDEAFSYIAYADFSIYICSTHTAASYRLNSSLELKKQ